MIPYLPEPIWKLGPLTVHGFGLAVATALATGYVLIQRRAPKAGLAALRAGRIYCAVVLTGLLMGYLWTGMSGISGTGLALGGGACLVAWAVASGRFWETLDLFAYAVPVTLAIARVGCFLAHDHIGRRTGCWLGVQFPDGIRYDLGLLYAIAAGLAAMIVWGLARMPLRAGVLSGLVLVLIATGRAIVLPLATGPRRPFDFWFAVTMAGTGILIAWVCQVSERVRGSF